MGDRAGTAVKVPVRLVTLAQDAIALFDLHGFEAMTTMIAARASLPPRPSASSRAH
jgi:hypothetical protein